ncbi:hypothetical protein PPUN15366_32480 [Pseudomonas putida]|nr:hypothetical protein PPUN15366_32480 [Pseudomonas putida]
MLAGADICLGLIFGPLNSGEAEAVVTEVMAVAVMVAMVARGPAMVTLVAWPAEAQAMRMTTNDAADAVRN